MKSSTPIIYIAGPISGMAGENKEAFYNAARALKNQGYIVRNPHEFCHDIPLESDRNIYMRRCLTQIAECSEIIMLPGWTHSIGAVLELKIAESLGMKVHFGMSNFEEIISADKEGRIA